MIRAGILMLPLATALGAATPPAEVDVKVTVNGLRNAKGQIRACLTAAPRNFPDCQKDAEAFTASVTPGAHGAVLTFEDVPPGRYAIALLHDENANGRADFALGMMPREGFGFSRDAKLRMGPPKFADAAFDVANGDRSMAIKMRYLF